MRTSLQMIMWVSLLNFSASVTAAQVCCAAAPTAESASATGDPAYVTLSDFNMVLSGGSGNFLNWTVGEFSPNYVNSGPSNDGCWNNQVNPAYVPEYINPASDPSTGHTWQVGAGNNYGPDQVGWMPASVSYIRNVASPSNPNGPLITAFPCGYSASQGLQIVCPGGAGGQVYIRRNLRREPCIKARSATVGQVYAAYFITEPFFAIGNNSAG